MRIIVIAHSEKTEAKAVRLEIISWIKNSGHEVVARTGKADLAIGLGGDGTVIHEVGYFSKKGIPYIVINAGEVGFLTTRNISDWKPVLKKLIAGKFIIEKREGLELTYKRKKFGPFVNDVYLKHSKTVASYKVTLNGNVLYSELGGDGFSVSTSTGSTGYNTSQGGPIVEPGVSCLLLTPLSPMYLNTRPIVANHDSEVVLEVVRKKPGEVFFVGNGKELGTLEQGEKITVRKHKKKLLLAVLDHHDFYRAVQEKKGLMK